LEEEPKKPSWENEALDAERPFLQQIEEKVLNAVSDKQFARELEWLEKTYYQDNKKTSVLINRRPVTHIKGLP
jgi:hypothetical protein